MNHGVYTLSRHKIARVRGAVISIVTVFLSGSHAPAVLVADGGCGARVLVVAGGTLRQLGGHAAIALDALHRARAIRQVTLEVVPCGACA